MIHGIINVLKPTGMSSHDVIGCLRRIYGMKKMGHAGTLDPLAAGVLPVYAGQATRLIDLATLTGACVTALGTVRTGMIGNDQEWMNRFFSAATEVHEKIWQLPADEEYEKLLESDVADLKNVGGPEAGAITAGLFLKQFVHDGTPWIHLDIAGPAFNEKADETGLIGATGVGIKSILHLLQGGVASHDR